jgi:hypothetical protein
MDTSKACGGKGKDKGKKKLEEIKEILPPATGTSHGMTGVSAEAVIPGQYPEFDVVELPENLKKKPWELDSSLD